jgi:hypothetical protein
VEAPLIVTRCLGGVEDLLITFHVEVPWESGDSHEYSLKIARESSSTALGRLQGIPPKKTCAHDVLPGSADLVVAHLTTAFGRWPPWLGLVTDMWCNLCLTL